MKKFIALLVSASIIAAPVAFAADEQTGSPDATMQQVDQTTTKHSVKKRHHQCHCKNCMHKHPKNVEKTSASDTQQ
ncbi:MAG: hypothetical protein K0S27_306 [Gammaproteobacteria bacterium]|jgi:Ni/Co efflux regulator RcnB|nr:hypothetical protein [Gammaproteobacteria bacterium]